MHPAPCLTQEWCQGGQEPVGAKGCQQLSIEESACEVAFPACTDSLHPNLEAVLLFTYGRWAQRSLSNSPSPRVETWTQAYSRGSLLSQPPPPHSAQGIQVILGSLTQVKLEVLPFLHPLSPRVLTCPSAVHELGKEHYEVNAWENVTAVRLGADSHHWRLLLLIFKSGSFSIISISSNQENTISQKSISLYSAYIHFWCYRILETYILKKI